MNFLEIIFARLRKTGDLTVAEEIRGREVHGVSGPQLLAKIQAARTFLADSGITKGDRCVLVAPNSVHWVAFDLAVMAEGAIAVPMYARQEPRELVEMMRDCAPKLICVSDAVLGGEVASLWPDSPAVHLLDPVFDQEAGGDPANPVQLADTDPVTIIYTSGTSGAAKGVVLHVGNLSFMTSCTVSRLGDVLAGVRGQEVYFHYLPLCFCGSWILLLTSLSRGSRLMLSTNLEQLRDELKLAAPHFFMNVPTLLERIRRGVEEKIDQRGGVVRKLYRKAKDAAEQSSPGAIGRAWLALADALIFRSIRRGLSPNLHALACGSAPLLEETQRFMDMAGIQVLQVYGLTETTGICTMDRPGQVEPGHVGHAIEGVEMKVGNGSEVLVRGQNVFGGYWNRPAETAAMFEGGWLRTGDQGECNERGNWRIIGRVKNLIILNSGHNIAPEPIEDQLLLLLSEAKQAILVGNDRSYVCAIITGDVSAERAEAAIERLNERLPHYRRIRGCHVSPEPLTAETGLLTANGKLKRDAIAAHFAEQIDAMYERRAV